MSDLINYLQKERQNLVKEFGKLDQNYISVIVPEEGKKVNYSFDCIQATQLNNVFKAKSILHKIENTCIKIIKEQEKLILKQNETILQFKNQITHKPIM